MSNVTTLLPPVSPPAEVVPVAQPSSVSLPTKIQEDHRARLAIVYVRQSTQARKGDILLFRA